MKKRLFTMLLAVLLHIALFLLLVLRNRTGLGGVALILIAFYIFSIGHFNFA